MGQRLGQAKAIEMSHVRAKGLLLGRSLRKKEAKGGGCVITGLRTYPSHFFGEQSERGLGFLNSQLGGDR